MQYLGSWIMLAMLNALGLYAEAERLRAQVAATRRQGGQRFIGRATLRVALDAVAVALSLGERCVEGVRWLATPSGAPLLRRAAPISATWTRRVLGRFASAEGAPVELHWRRALSLLATVPAADERAVFYVDHHLRPYTGKHTIRQGWRMQDERVRPGVTDYYVHDEEGRPLLRLDDPGNGPSTDWLAPVGRLLREALGGKTRVPLAFDRGGAFVEELALLRDGGWELGTYERAPSRWLPAQAFAAERALGRRCGSWRASPRTIHAAKSAWLGPELPRAAEAKKTLAKLPDATGTIRLNRRTVPATLESAGTRAEPVAFDALLGRLNTLELHLPGDHSRPALRFQLANQ